MLHKENRLHPRAEIQWPIRLLTTRGFVEARLKNLSADGAYIHCDQTSTPHNFVPLTIEPPNHSPLKITAEVVWADNGLSPGMGVRFAEISEIDRKFLIETIANHYERKVARTLENRETAPRQKRRA
jgi:hypothetical protein